MKDFLDITLVQYDIAWEEKEKNFVLLENLLKKITTDLIILPEMFQTGFSMRIRKLAESGENLTLKWMKKLAESLSTSVIGSFITLEGEKYFNRLYLVNRGGVAGFYDKKHLFRMSGEDRFFSPGNSTGRFDVGGWKIAPFICYDLRFPVWSRNKNNEYDLALYIANWPDKRAVHFEALLKARAIENLAFIAGVNRIGKDGNGLYYEGGSRVIDPTGTVIANCENKQMIQTIRLLKTDLEEYRINFPAWKDADPFDLKN